MKKICVLIIAMVQMVVLVSCQPKQESNLTHGPADMEPPRFTTEQEMAEYLKGLGEAVKIDRYYQLNTVPDGMKFDSYSSYFNYVDWWYFDANVSQEARFIYLRWDFAENGQERLEYDLNENGAGRIELQADDRIFYYLTIDDPKLYDIEWLQDGYLFSMNIPAAYIAPDGDLNASFLLKYTELNKVLIDN